MLDSPATFFPPRAKKARWCGCAAVVLVGWALAAATPSALAQTATQPADFQAQVDALAQKAWDQVLASAQSKDPFCRDRAIEAATPAVDRVAPLAQRGIDDESPVVRFVALVTIGKLKLKDLAPAAKLRLTAEATQIKKLRGQIEEQRGRAGERELANMESALNQYRSVAAAALFALRQCGQDVDVTPLSTMLASEDLKLRSNVVMLVGLMGDPSAIPMLKDKGKAPAPRESAENQGLWRLHITEALIRLGDNDALNPLFAAVYSKMSEVRELAVELSGELSDRALIPALQHLVVDKENETLELRVAAAVALARMGDNRGLAVLQEAAKSDMALLRDYAARGLGLVREPESARLLGVLLDDKVEQVRLSAAAAVLRARGPEARPTPPPERLEP
jgi:HEAT repeat protein